MKGYVITIDSLPQSVQAAERCIKSAARNGTEVEMFAASTPADNPQEYLQERGVPTEGFREVYSRFDNCVAAFTSHYRLWEKAYNEKETLLVLEHDAYFVDQIPNVTFTDILSFGHPSYGRWQTPPNLGKNTLVSKQYLPGAHAYAVTPQGAGKLLETAKVCAGPTDIFISNQNFDCVEEYYPWPVEAKDSFSTIQSDRGIAAKHQYQKLGDRYELLGVK